MSSSPPLIELDGVVKAFGPSVALAGLDLRVRSGQITVLLGPNGAGKTTAIRMITGAFTPDAGTVRTFGLDPGRDGDAVRARCGVVSAKPSLYDRLNGWDNLRYSAELHGLGRGPTVDARIAEAAGRFGIDVALDAQVGSYSTGMKTRLALARSVLHHPDLLLYDEPTSGLDPESSHAVLGLVREMAAEGATVVMSTHLLLEAEGLADQVVMMENGTTVMAGSTDDLMRRYWPRPVVRFGAEDESGLDVLAGMEGVMSYHRNGAGAEVELDDLARVPGLIASLAGAGVRLTAVTPHERSLEELYLRVRQR